MTYTSTLRYVMTIRKFISVQLDLWKNGEISESETLAMVWHWLHLSKSLVENGYVTCSSRSSHPGIR